MPWSCFLRVLARSDHNSFGSGVPQGSVRSPLLFVLYSISMMTAYNYTKSVIRPVRRWHDSLFEHEFNTRARDGDIQRAQQSYLEFQRAQSKKNILQNQIIVISLLFCQTDCSPTNILDEAEIDEDYLSKFLGLHLAQGSALKCHVDSGFSKFCKTVMERVVQHSRGSYYCHCPISISWRCLSF